MIANMQEKELRRRSVRLPDHGYAGYGTYFITICAEGRSCLFGEVVGDAVNLSPTGRIVADEWMRTATLRRNVELHEFVVMPNHFHGLLTIHEQGGCNTPLPEPPRPFRTLGGNLGAIVRGFKGASTRRINELLGVRSPVWQRSYHERVVRGERQFEAIVNYIRENPARWDDDPENPDRRGRASGSKG
jgi:REP element-mobilizing transposase RayT